MELKKKNSMGRVMKDISTEFEKYIHDLENCAPHDLNEVPEKAGIYVLFENRRATYVGRSGNLRKRLKGHLQDSHYSASFAFLLAKEKAKRKKIKLRKTRSANLANRKFKIIFDECRDRVKKMKVKYVLVPNDHRQTLAEVLVVMVYGIRRYNKFKTH